MAKKEKERQEESDGSVAVNDAWTGMLAVSLVALVLGTAFLSYEAFFLYGGDLPKVEKMAPAPSMKKVDGAPVPPKDGVAPKDGAKDAVDGAKDAVDGAKDAKKD